MSDTRRAKRTNNPRLALVSNGPGAEDGVELAELRELLSALGAPVEVLQALDGPGGPDEIVQHLLEAGLLPSPEESFAGLIEGFRPLLKAGTTALDAELSGAEFLGLLRATAPDPDAVPTMLADMVGQAEVYGKPEALAMARVLAAVGPAQVRSAATEAADRMVARGLKDRPWAAGLGRPQAGPCFGYTDFFGSQEAIAIIFGYGRRRHALLVLIDHNLGGGVKDCWVSDDPDRIRGEYQRAARFGGLDLQDYEPGEARAILDRALSNPPCPVAPDQVEDVAKYLDLLRQRVSLLPAAGPTAAAPRTTGPVRQRQGSARSGRTVHRAKVSLRGAKPPIWRRLEVPSSYTLQQLHHAIQQAFGWQDCHMWVFQTPSGDYGLPDSELGHRSAAAKKLQDVAPRTGDRIRYTYDFGDDWEHDIVIEDVLGAESGVAYPRCLAGRRACPPEDCGGIWGYQELLEILTDPDHEEHHDRLEWLGLASSDDLMPAAFNLDTANKALSTMARVLTKT